MVLRIDGPFVCTTMNHIEFRRFEIDVCFMSPRVSFGALRIGGRCLWLPKAVENPDTDYAQRKKPPEGGLQRTELN